MGIKYCQIPYSHSIIRSLLADYFLSQAFFAQSSFWGHSVFWSHAALSLQQAFVESQATESLLQQVVADSAASTATEVESAAASELAVLLPPHETIAKENATIAAAKKNFVFILKIFALNVYKYSIANINKNK